MCAEEKDYEQKLEDMATKSHNDIMAVLNNDDFWAGFDERLAAQHAEENAKLQAFKESGKFEVVMQWIRDHFAKPETKWKHVWDEDIAYCAEKLGCNFDHNDFRYTLDALIENVEREEIDEAGFDTTMWTTGEFYVEEVFGQGSLYGIGLASEKEDRIKHITSWADEE